MVSVSGYTRRVGRKGQRSPKREKKSSSNAAAPGSEFINKKAAAESVKKRPLTPKEEKWMRDWDAAARKASMRSSSFAYDRQKGINSYSAKEEPKKSSMSDIKKLTKRVFNFIKKKK